jgi:hypothetical protein
MVVKIFYCWFKNQRRYYENNISGTGRGLSQVRIEKIKAIGFCFEDNQQHVNRSDCSIIVEATFDRSEQQKQEEMEDSNKESGVNMLGDELGSRKSPHTASSSHNQPASRSLSELESSPSPPAKRHRSTSFNNDAEQQQPIRRVPELERSCFLKPNDTICSHGVSCTIEKCVDIQIRQSLYGYASNDVDITKPFFWDASYTNRLRPVNVKDDDEVWHHTISYVNRSTGVFVLPQGCNGQCNNSGVWWYTTKGDAYAAISKTVGRLRALDKSGF